MGCSLLPDNSVDGGFFDPQYSSVLARQNYGNEGETRGKDRAALPLMDDAITRLFEVEIARGLKPDSYTFAFMDKFQLGTGVHLRYFAGTDLELVDLIIWDKDRMGMGRRSRCQFEVCVAYQKRNAKSRANWSHHFRPAHLDAGEGVGEAAPVRGDAGADGVCRVPSHRPGKMGDMRRPDRGQRRAREAGADPRRRIDGQDRRPSGQARRCEPQAQEVEQGGGCRAHLDRGRADPLAELHQHGRRLLRRCPEEASLRADAPARYRHSLEPRSQALQHRGEWLADRRQS
jgi:hypothetical protein